MTSQEQEDSNMPSGLSRGTVRLIGQDGKISDRKFHPIPPFSLFSFQTYVRISIESSEGDG